MGGIKNRDAKRAAAKVFSSAGGGGSKGPSVVDKRGQEEKCPHCDRVFKQNSRLKEHIGKQHADQVQQEQPSAPPAAHQRLASSSSTSRPPVPGSHKAGDSTAIEAAAASTAKAAAAAAASCSKPSSSSSSSIGSTKLSDSRGTAGSSSSSQTYDVGSRAGFYTEKSPKLMLHEWCMQQKRPKPKYKAVAVEPDKGGGFRARIILPDPRLPGTDKDVVVWLDADHAADHEEEALQRGAVAALQTVAGDRSLDYILPQRYRPLWKDIKNKASERAEAQRRAAAAAAERQAQATRCQNPARTPVSVVMSEKQRQAVEDLMQDLSTGDSTAVENSSNGSASAARLVNSESYEDAEVRQGFLDSLIKAGFSAADSTAAVRAVGVSAGEAAAAAASAATAAASAGGHGYTRVWRSHDGLQPYLDWLCLHLPVERLPARYRPGGSSSTVGVLRVNKPSSSSSLQASARQPVSVSAEGADGGPDWQHDPHVQQLVSYGYPPDHAMHALQSCGGDLLTALHLLQQQLLAGSSNVDAVDAGAFSTAVAAAAADADSIGVSQAWQDEVEVLTAIYGDDLQTTDAGMLCLSQDTGDQVGGNGQLQLLAWCPRQQQQYPEAAPLIALQCSQMPASQLLSLTAKLAATAQQCLGNPMIHELAVQLAEEVEAAAAAGEDALVPGLPAPFDQPHPSSQQQSVPDAETAADTDADGYTAAAQQHAAAAEAMLEDASSNGVSSSRFTGQKRQRPRTGLSVEQAAHESKRLKEHYARLQTDASYAAMKGARSRLPAFSCRNEVLCCVANNDVVVISGATGCGKSTQVPQYIFEEAVASGGGGKTNIIICQPRRIAAVGLATRVADEVGDAAGVGGLVGYSVRLDTKSSQYTRMLFCTTGVLLRRLMNDPNLEGVTHVILDEVHERNLESDLLLLLLRRTLMAAAMNATQGLPPPPKILLMSATADAQLFAEYFSRAGTEALLLGGMSAGSITATTGVDGKRHQQQMEHGLSVGLLSIPGFTHPVQQLWLEDALQATGIVVGKQSKYARQKRPKASSYQQEVDDGSDFEPLKDSNDAAQWYKDETPSAQHKQPHPQQQRSRLQQQRHTHGSSTSGAIAQTPPRGPYADTTGNIGQSLGVDAPLGNYNQEVIRSLELVDPAIINYELIEALLVHVLSVQLEHEPMSLQQDRVSKFRPTKAVGVGEGQLGAVLIFMPGAPEIDKLVRQLQTSRKLLEVGGRGVRVLPLHGGLPPSVQSKVFERPPKGVLKVIVATNVAETSLTIDDVTVVIDTGRHKEMSYDHSRGLSCLVETWVSQAAAQQRRGRAGRVAPGTCYRLWPSSMWKRLAPRQPPEVLRVPLQQLCLTTKAALAASTPGGSVDIMEALACLLTPPSMDSVREAVLQLSQLGALQTSPEEVLTPLGTHLAAMPMDAALGKALLYGCMLRCASPLLTIAAALGHGRPLWLAPPVDRRAEIAAARQALAPQAYAQRSDHLAIVATFNGWLSARAIGGRVAALDFAKTYHASDQALEAICKGRLDLALVLQQRGFLPDWYLEHLKQLQRSGVFERHPNDNSTPSAEVYGAIAVNSGAPDEHSHNARIVKAAICAGFYPRILRVEAPVKYQQVQGGAMRVEASPSTIKFFERSLGRVWMHPASVCFSAGSYPSGWVVFTQLVETSRPFVREGSMVPVYALLAFGGHLEVLHEQGLLLLDSWAKFKAPARVGVLIKHLRHAVSQLLAAKLHNPLMESSSQRVIAALHQLLATDGF